MGTKCVCFFVAILLYGCDSIGQKQGVVINHTYFYGDDSLGTSPPLEIRRKILFKENQSIQEVPLMILSGDSSKQEISIQIKHYSYLKPDENVCYNYRNFSDTAKPIKGYSDIDSVTKDGGWNFYSNKKIEYESLINISDTTINNIMYGRIRMNKKINDNDIYLILYYRCDKKGTLIKVFKSLSDSIGCPIVRDDTYIKNTLFMTEELEFFSDKLSSDDLNVFASWERNTKQNPIHKN